MRGIGGSERHLLDTAPGARRARHRAVFVGLDDPAWDASDFYDALRVPAIRIPAPRDVDRCCSLRLARDARAPTSCTRISCTPTSTAASRRSCAARSSSRRSTTTIRFAPAPFRYVERGLSRLADRVIAITDALREFTIERVGVARGKVETIHYGLDDLPAAWGVNPPDDVPADARVLLAVARLTRQKGIDVAIARCRSSPTTRCSSCSAKGRSARRSRHWRASSASSKRVFLPGRVPDVAAWLRPCDGARPSGALGRIRARRARSDARRAARWSRRTSARCRSSSSTARPACSCSPTIRRRSPSASPVRSSAAARRSRPRPCASASSRSRGWPTAPPRSTRLLAAPVRL